MSREDELHKEIAGLRNALTPYRLLEDEVRGYGFRDLEHFIDQAMALACAAHHLAGTTRDLGFNDEAIVEHRRDRVAGGKKHG